MNETSSIRVLIADDQELVRAGFAMVIDSQDDMAVVSQASNGDEAVATSAELQPDVVLMDVRMPGMDGIEATRRITDTAEAAGRTVRVIILTTFDLDEYVMSAINAGASGFLLKDTEPETLLSSIRTVYQGNAIIAPSATKRLIEKMSETSSGAGHVSSPSLSQRTSIETNNNAVNSPTVGSEGEGSSAAGMTSPDAAATPVFFTDPELDDLTDREREVLIEVAHGLSNQEISDKLFISMPTVKTHVAHVLSKIHARNRVQAVVFAYDNHLV